MAVLRPRRVKNTLARTTTDNKSPRILDREEIDRANAKQLESGRRPQSQEEMARAKLKQFGKGHPPLSKVLEAFGTNPFSEDRGMLRMRLAGQAVGG